MLARVSTCAVEGLDGYIVSAEVDISPGLPSFSIVGLPDTAVQEARERVRAAIRNSGCEFPMRRITVNLAPADTRKAGPSYDLPIAMGILISSGQVSGSPDSALFNSTKLAPPTAARDRSGSVGDSGAQSEDGGSCIRCGREIDLDPDRPLCRGCYQVWSQYSNSDFEERCCLVCGDERRGITYAKPLCYPCYSRN